MTASDRISAAMEVKSVEEVGVCRDVIGRELKALGIMMARDALAASGFGPRLGLSGRP